MVVVVEVEVKVVVSVMRAKNKVMVAGCGLTTCVRRIKDIL